MKIFLHSQPTRKMQSTLQIAVHSPVEDGQQLSHKQTNVNRSIIPPVQSPEPTPAESTQPPSRKRPRSCHSTHVPEQPRKRRVLDTKDCAVCGTSKTSSRGYPRGSATGGCNHPCNTCRKCLAQWIASQLDMKGPANISCSECSSIMSFDDVKRNADQATFIRYDTLLLASTLSADATFRYCASPSCTAGQMHEAGTDAPIFRCNACGHSTCIVCNTDWHPDRTHEENRRDIDQEKKQSEKRRAENKASQKLIKKVTKECPKCKVNIQKSTGCDHMRCEMCKHEFCWLCMADYTSIRNNGNSGHARHCQHHSI